jgi:SAM-dependent methyltransferase
MNTAMEKNKTKKTIKKKTDKIVIAPKKRIVARKASSKTEKKKIFRKKNRKTEKAVNYSREDGTIAKGRNDLKKTINVRMTTSVNPTIWGNFVDPERLVEKLGFLEGMKVADLGVGTGYFAFPVARKVGDSGIVFALDVVSEKLEAIESQAKILGIFNIITKRANLEEKRGSGLKSGSMDWSILVNMLFQNKNKKSIISEAARVLKTGGKMLVLEWNEKPSPFGPDLRLRIPKSVLVEIIEDAGLFLEKEADASSFHYCLVFSKRK